MKNICQTSMANFYPTSYKPGQQKPAENHCQRIGFDILFGLVAAAIDPTLYEVKKVFDNPEATADDEIYGNVRLSLALV